jgi:hypothetical protein
MFRFLASFAALDRRDQRKLWLGHRFLVMALDRRGPRQSDLWSASPSGKSPFLLVRSDRDQHVITLILA